MITTFLVSTAICAALTGPAVRALREAFPEVPPEFFERQLLI